MKDEGRRQKAEGWQTKDEESYPLSERSITMINLRLANERGHTQFDWLDGRHTFSFGRYIDREHMSFGPLRVINDDHIAPSGGFPEHGHDNMEILTWILDGELQHSDSLGNGSVIRPGQMQMMSAGSGIRHSEFNASSEKPVHLLQIWIEPNERNAKPRYAEATFDGDAREGKFQLLATGNGHGGNGDTNGAPGTAMAIRADTDVFVGEVKPGQRIEHTLPDGATAWLHVAFGDVTINGHAMTEGDGASVSDETTLAVEGNAASQVLLFVFE